MQNTFGAWQSFIYACIAAIVIAAVAFAIMQAFPDPSSAVFSVPGSVRL